MAAPKPNQAGYGTIPVTGNQVPTSSGSGVATGNGPMTNYGTTQTPTSGTKPGGGTNWWGTLTDPNLWNAILGTANAVANRPKDGKWVETPMPPEVRALMQQYMGYAQNSPTRNFLAPMAFKMMEATGIPKFQMTNLIEGPGIPKPMNGQPWTYQSGGNPSAFNFGDFASMFQDYLAGKGGGVNSGPKDLSNVKGPNGNPIGQRGRSVAWNGGKQKDQGEWQTFNWETGGATGYDRANSGMGARDSYGMVIEGWKKDALQNPAMAAQYQRYHDWLGKLPPDQLQAEMAKQQALEQKVKAYGKDFAKSFFLEGGFLDPVGFATRKVLQYGWGMAQDAAGNWVVNKTGDPRWKKAIDGLVWVANNARNLGAV